MRGVVWLAVIGGAGVGCWKKEPPPLPNVSLDRDAPKVAVAPPDPFAGRVGAIEYRKLWTPKGAMKADAAAVVKRIAAQRYFASHQTEYLAAATAGTAATAGWGGLHALVVPPALAASYPDVAKKIEATWKDGVATAVWPGPALDYSVRGTGATTVRVLVIRVEGGTDDELRTRFGEYLGRLEPSVEAEGVTIVSRQRGGPRGTGALSDIHYRAPTLAGYVRSVVVRGHDPADVEFATVMLGDVTKGGNLELFKSVMAAEKGPFLVVALREQRQ